MSGKQYSRQDLHLETARINWQELETHFARGVVIRVDSDLDLLEVARCFANDDKPAVEDWINNGKVQHLGMQEAKDWGGRDPELWAVVVAPWVVVQERKN
ncbi:MAG: DUF2288 family protein [Thiogranum sp.]